MTIDQAMTTERAIEFEHEHCAHNYHPLPVVISEGEGAWVTDVEGRRYLDMLSAYSAINFGHGHPALIAAAEAQLHRITLTSRAFHNDQLGEFCAALSRLARHEAVLPMNSGAEAVETALKLSRKWGYQKKGVAAGQAEIIVCAGNFHGRTTTIISFSDDPVARDDYGPYTPGFVEVPYGDIDALAEAINENTVAFLVEPIQGEAGVVLPPAGFLKAARTLCAERNVLFVADEIQAGLGRAGATFACDLVDVQPDIRILGKALGGGILPVSAVTADWAVLGVITAAPSAETPWRPLSASRCAHFSRLVRSRSAHIVSASTCSRRFARQISRVSRRSAAAASGGPSSSTARGRPAARSASSSSAGASSPRTPTPGRSASPRPSSSPSPTSTRHCEPSSTSSPNAAPAPPPDPRPTRRRPPRSTASDDGALGDPRGPSAPHGSCRRAPPVH